MLIANLIARERFGIAYPVTAIALAYGLTLLLAKPHLQALEPMAAFRAVLQILGGFSLLQLLAAGWFTFAVRPRARRRRPELPRKSRPPAGATDATIRSRVDRSSAAGHHGQEHGERRAEETAVTCDPSLVGPLDGTPMIR